MCFKQNQCLINDIDFDFSNDDFEIFDYKNLLALESLFIAFLCACLFFL